MHNKVIIIAILAVMIIAGAVAYESVPVVNSAFNRPITYDPVPADIAEDGIFYDTAPVNYWPNLYASGTKMAVRFTPLQPCSLTYIQIVSWDTSGTVGQGILHIMSDNNGNPDADLIPPFTIDLNGNPTVYQSYNLPSAIDVGENDFHVVVEYTRDALPFVLGDRDGNTESRSKSCPAVGDDWHVLNNDICFRAWVNYYGNDIVPPLIEHINQELGFSYDDNHVIKAKITDASGIALANLNYSTNGVDWNVLTMTNTEGDIYEAGIPIQPVGSVIMYYFNAVDASLNANESVHPPDGQTDPYVMQIVEGSEICYNDGEADSWHVVTSSFEDNAFAVRMTPSYYPVKVAMARVLVSDNTPFEMTVNGVSGNEPGDVLPGGEAIQVCQGITDWAVGEWGDTGPVISSGDFYIVFHWYENTPDDPAVGLDSDNHYLRSFWYFSQVEWNSEDDGEYIINVNVVSYTGIEDNGDRSRPAGYELIGNFPNPFNPQTDIKFQAPEAGNVRIDVYNIAGQLVKTVLDEYITAGIKTITWDGTNANGNAVNSGVYFYKMTAGNVVLTNKMVLVK